MALGRHEGEWLDEISRAFRAGVFGFKVDGEVVSSWLHSMDGWVDSGGVHSYSSFFRVMVLSVRITVSPPAQVNVIDCSTMVSVVIACQEVCGFTTEQGNNEYTTCSLMKKKICTVVISLVIRIIRAMHIDGQTFEVVFFDPIKLLSHVTLVTRDPLSADDEAMIHRGKQRNTTGLSRTKLRHVTSSRTAPLGLSTI